MLKDFAAYRMASEFHRTCRRMKVAHYLEDQLLRASSSIVLNLAEGSARRTPSEQRRFYNIALSSLRECEAIFELDGTAGADLRTQLDALGAVLFTLSRGPKPKLLHEKTETPV